MAAKKTGAHISQQEVARRAAEASERRAQQRLNDLRQQAAVGHHEYETSLGMDKIAQQAQAEASQHRELLKDEFQEQQRAQAIKEDRDRAAQELAAERYQGMSRRTDNCL